MKMNYKISQNLTVTYKNYNNVFHNWTTRSIQSHGEPLRRVYPGNNAHLIDAWKVIMLPCHVTGYKNIAII